MNAIIDSMQQKGFEEGEPACAWGTHTYIRTSRKAIRTRRLDRNDGAALRVAPVKGSDPKPQNEPCRQVRKLLLVGGIQKVRRSRQSSAHSLR